MLFKTSYKTCKSIRKRFSDYLDGALDQGTRQFVHDHVKFCEPCSLELDRLNRTLSMLSDFREESLTAAMQNFRLPRYTFIEIFPSIREEKPEITVGFWAPYVSVALFYVLVLTTWIGWERYDFQKQYNASNYIEVVAKS